MAPQKVKKVQYWVFSKLRTYLIGYEFFLGSKISIFAFTESQICDPQQLCCCINKSIQGSIFVKISQKMCNEIALCNDDWLGESYIRGGPISWKALYVVMVGCEGPPASDKMGNLNSWYDFRLVEILWRGSQKSQIRKLSWSYQSITLHFS